MSTMRRFTFAGFALLYLAITLCSTGQLRAQKPAVVLLEPQTLSLGQGQISSVVVRIEGAANVYGVQLELSFDAEKIQVLDTDEVKAGVQILAGDFLALDEGFIAANEANNETGQLTYALTLLDPAEPASGAGTLVEFEVEALETGSIDLLLSTVILASKEGAQLPVQLVNEPENDSAIIVPSAAATETAPPTATESSPVTETQTTEDILTPSSSPESAVGAAPATASSAAGNTRQPAASEAATVVTPGELATRPVAVQTPLEEPEPTVVNPSAAETAEVDQAAEIAAAPPAVEKEESLPAEDQPSPALTVIGQNRNSDENRLQPGTPAPSANSEETIEGPMIAIGLVLLIVALIAIWFLRRLVFRTR